MDILLIPCSIRPGGLSPRVAVLLSRFLQEGGAQVRSFNLGTLPLHGTGTPGGFPPAVQELRDLVLQAAAIVWVTPTYHNEMPGVAKNALDWLDTRVMAGKRNGVIGASNLTGHPAAIAIGNCVRFIGGRLPMDDLYIGALRTVWPLEAEGPPADIVEKVRGWAGRFIEVVREAPEG